MALAALLAAELVAAAVLLVLPGADVAAGPGAPAGPAPLAVGTGRTVQLINRGGEPGELLLARIAADIGAAVPAVEAFWGDDWPRRIVVVATGSEPQFAAEAGSGDDAAAGRWSDIAAVTVADEVNPARRFAAGQRIVFAPGAVQMSPAALRIVVGHELFHYAARADTALDAPRWLVEGVADFVARPAAAPVELGAPPLTLPSDADLDAAGPQRARAYDRAWWFARFVAESYRPARLRELYLAACGPEHTDLPTAVRLVLGTDLADVLTRWQQWSSRAR